MSIVVLGTTALDTVTTPFGKRKEMLGGSAVHFSMSASHFSEVQLVAVVGRDFPKKHINFLKNKGIDLRSLAVEEGKSFRWEGEYRGDMNTALTLSTELGVLSNFKPKILPVQARVKNIFLANVDPDIQSYLLSKMHSPKMVGLDTMNFWIDHKKQSVIKLLKKVHIFVANDAEARSLSGEHNLIKAAKCLNSFGAPIVIVKKGEHGVLVFSRDFIFCLPAYPVEKIVDPTGAGDTFAGGVMGYLAYSGKVNLSSVRKSVCFGTAMASFNVEGFGVERSSKISKSDIRGRLSLLKKITKF